MGLQGRCEKTYRYGTTTNGGTKTVTLPVTSVTPRPNVKAFDRRNRSDIVQELLKKGEENKIANQRARKNEITRRMELEQEELQRIEKEIIESEQDEEETEAEETEDEVRENLRRRQIRQRKIREKLAKQKDKEKEYEKSIEFIYKLVITKNKLV